MKYQVNIKKDNAGRGGWELARRQRKLLQKWSSPLLSLFHLFGSPQIGITFFKVMNFYYNCPLQFRFHLWIIPWYFVPQTKGVSWKISWPGAMSCVATKQRPTPGLNTTSTFKQPSWLKWESLCQSQKAKRQAWHCNPGSWHQKQNMF